ncbi:protein transporter Sec31, partial [Streptomyces sp. SID11233]|nr:protein transporter Sec31 [Streptomyces sp. SID11233]
AGDTRLVPEEYDVLVPVAPRDWDRTILRAVITATILTTVASIAWTTASIGGLLTTQVHPVIAYGAAAAG